MKNYSKALRVNILLIIITLAVGCWFSFVLTIPTKAVASGAFMLMGAVNMYCCAAMKRGKPKFALWMLAALVVTFVADIVLELNFMYGAMVFGLGHVGYSIAYGKLEKWQKRDLVPFALLFAAAGSVIMFLPVFDFGDPPVMQYVCLAYALVISAMLGKAISNYIRVPGATTMLVFVGSLMFFVSDLLLLFRHFADTPSILTVISVNIYYPAQAILAYSVLRSVREEE